MENKSHAQVSAQRKQSTHPPLVFRFKRQAAPGIREQSGPVSPFTETPEELKNWHAPSNGKQHKFLNALILLLLGLALIVLVIAFAYQLIFHPQVLSNAAVDLVALVEGFFQSLFAMQ